MFHRWQTGRRRLVFLPAGHKKGCGDFFFWMADFEDFTHTNPWKIPGALLKQQLPKDCLSLWEFGEEWGIFLGYVGKINVKQQTLIGCPLLPRDPFFAHFDFSSPKRLHPGRLTWNLQIIHLERKMIFQTFIIMFHVNLPGCTS